MSMTSSKNLKSVSEREKKLVASSFAMINFTKNLMSIFVKNIEKDDGSNFV